MKKYKSRVSDAVLMRKLKSAGAVLIEGAKWCGKTTSATQFANSVLYMQDPDQQNLELAAIKPSRLLQGDVPRLIDEWQVAPQLWDSIRFEVDRRDEFGQFILTGSSVPADMSKVHHSGAGRITKMIMRPMSLFESGESSGEVSLSKLFEDDENLEKNVEGHNNIDLDQMAFLICRGGWPRSLDCKPEIALQQAVNYYSTIIETDISETDNIRRNKERVSRLMRSCCRLIGSQINIQTVCQDLAINEAHPLSDETVSSYITALKNIFVVENSPAWNPNLRSKTAVRTSDTLYFTDPSIGIAALGIGPNDLVNDLRTMGLLFENLCVRDLRIYAEALDGNVYHYRDKNGLECDAVIHLRNGKYGLIEIKLGGEHRISEGSAILNKLESNIDTQKMPKPSFKMVLTAVGQYAYKQKDGVLIVPIGSLKI